MMQGLNDGNFPTFPERLRRYRQIIALFGAVAILVLLWRMSRPAYFPRHESDFLGGAALDRRLERMNQRLKTDPDDIRAQVESGMLLFQKGKDFYPDAINYLDDAWEHGALDPRIFYYMGVMYQEEGLYRDAAKQYMMFLRNYPRDQEVRLLTAKLLYQNGQFEDAVAQYGELRKKHPKDALIAENLALSLKALKRYDEAKAELQSLAALGASESRRAHFYFGQIAAEQGDFRNAMREYLAVMPADNPEIGIPPLAIYTAIAENYDKLNAPIMAKEAWDKVIALDPQNKQGRIRLRALNHLLSQNKKKGRSRRR